MARVGEGKMAVTVREIKIKEIVETAERTAAHFKFKAMIEEIKRERNKQQRGSANDNGGTPDTPFGDFTDD